MNYAETASYKPVYNSLYYRMHYPQIAEKVGMTEESLFAYFVQAGMDKGHQGSCEFNVYSYQRWNPDLKLGKNLSVYYMHYIEYGRAEGRVAIGSPLVKQVSEYNGIDYSPVYRFEEYVSYNRDVWELYGFQPDKVLEHFVQHGMNERRRGNSNFDVNAYRRFNDDVEKVLGDNWQAYYLHFVQYGVRENRRAV